MQENINTSFDSLPFDDSLRRPGKLARVGLKKLGLYGGKTVNLENEWSGVRFQLLSVFCNQDVPSAMFGVRMISDERLEAE